MTPASMVMYQVNTEGMMVSAFDISDTHQCMTFGDTGGMFFLCSAHISSFINYGHLCHRVGFCNYDEYVGYMSCLYRIDYTNCRSVPSILIYMYLKLKH